MCATLYTLHHCVVLFTLFNCCCVFCNVVYTATGGVGEATTGVLWFILQLEKLTGAKTDDLYF